MREVRSGELCVKEGIGCGNLIGEGGTFVEVSSFFAEFRQENRIPSVAGSRPGPHETPVPGRRRKSDTRNRNEIPSH